MQMSGKSGKRIALQSAGTIFGLGSLAHLVRWLRADEIIVEGFTVPVGWSLIVALALLLLSAWMFWATKA